MLETNSPVRLISRVEYTEHIRKLPISQRIIYFVASIAVVLLAFIVLSGIAIGIATFVFGVVLGENLAMDDILLLAVPIVAAFMVSMGFSGTTMPEAIPAGDTFGDFIRRTLLAGLVVGAMGGFVFGLLWSFAIRIGAFYIQLNTQFGDQIFIREIIVTCLVMTLVVAPTFALFRTFASAAGPVILHALDHSKR